MAQISYNSVFDAVTLALRRFFPSAKIRGEAAKQGLNPGDFTVLPITPAHTGQMGSRAQRSVTFDVIYYPAAKDSRTECLDVAERLPYILGTVSTPEGDHLHGTGFECRISDDVLHCIVRYPYFVYVPEESEPIESLSIIQEV